MSDQFHSVASSWLVWSHCAHYIMTRANLNLRRKRRPFVSERVCAMEIGASDMPIGAQRVLLVRLVRLVRLYGRPIAVKMSAHQSLCARSA